MNQAPAPVSPYAYRKMPSTANFVEWGEEKRQGGGICDWEKPLPLKVWPASKEGNPLRRGGGLMEEGGDVGLVRAERVSFNGRGRGGRPSAAKGEDHEEKRDVTEQILCHNVSLREQQRRDKRALTKSVKKKTIGYPALWRAGRRSET